MRKRTELTWMEMDIATMTVKQIRRQNCQYDKCPFYVLPVSVNSIDSFLRIADM